MAAGFAYKITIGSQIASSEPHENTLQLLSLRSELTMDGVGGYCEVELSGGKNMPPVAEPGDVLEVELDAGQGSIRVFTGTVESISTGASQWITAQDDLIKLTRHDVALAFEEVSADFIVNELLDEVGLTAGIVETGPQLASYVLHSGPRAFRHIQTLAELCGTDLYTDGEGKAHFTSPSTRGAEHSFKYGESILVLDLKRVPPQFDGVSVWGEGAASSKGAEKYYWLAEDLEGVSAEASISEQGELQSGTAGERNRLIRTGAVRSGEAAQAVADGQMSALVARGIQGRLKAFATPAVMPGDTVKIEDLPDEHAANKALQEGGMLRVRRVRHELDRRDGFVTLMEF